MMIIEQILSETLVKHYSNASLKISQVETGAVYGEAVDVIPCRYTYEETDEPIEESDIEDGEALGIITGGAYEAN